MKTRVIEQNQSPSQTLTLYLSGEQTILRGSSGCSDTWRSPLLGSIWTQSRSFQADRKTTTKKKKQTADLWVGNLDGTEVWKRRRFPFCVTDSAAEHLIKNNDGTRPRKISNFGRDTHTQKKVVLTVTLDPLLCIIFFFWSFYQVFCRKSIVPCHTLDECFLSSANPKWTKPHTESELLPHCFILTQLEVEGFFFFFWWMGGCR